MTNFWDDTLGLACVNEAEVEVTVVEPLLAALGYVRDDIAPKYPVRFQTGRRGRPHEADFVVFFGKRRSRDNSLIVLEAKRPGESFADAKDQAESYAQCLRTPYYIVTDGCNFELWQLQPTTESTLLVQSPLKTLGAYRGVIEASVSKDAAFAYCQSLQYKSGVSIAVNLTDFIHAELNRISPAARSTQRTLRNSNEDSGRTICSDDLLTTYPQGAIIVGPSGFGKSTLAERLLRYGLEAQPKTGHQSIVCAIFLPDLYASGYTPTAFVNARLAAHCPAISEAVLRQMLREQGALFLFDGFDRLSSNERAPIQSHLRSMSRDFPLLQVIVFSRNYAKPELNLPTLVLEPLSQHQRREFLQYYDLDEYAVNLISNALPKPLKALSDHPLLLSLLADYWEKHARLPDRIEDLFLAWLNQILSPSSTSRSVRLHMQRGLTLLANATTESPIRTTKALSLLQDSGLADTVFDDLLRCDAIRENGTTVELQHEALSDYLRALDITATEEGFRNSIADIVLTCDSLLPILLMAMLKQRDLQRLLWKKLANTNLSTYIEALRFRANLAPEFTSHELEVATKNFLEDILEGILDPLNGFFPIMQKSILSSLCGRRTSGLMIDGLLSENRKWIDYSLRAAEAGTPLRVSLVGDKGYGGRHGVNLEASRLRADSGRLIATRHLENGLMDALNARTLHGGVVWSSERLISRLRYMDSEYWHGLHQLHDLMALEVILQPNAAEIVFVNRAGRLDSTFLIQDLLDDIAFLKDEGISTLEQWWPKIIDTKRGGGVPTDDNLRELLNTHYHRVQLAYVELCEHSLKQQALTFGMYRAMPIRWELELTPSRFSRVTVHKRWRPVKCWENAGADVKFVEKESEAMRSLDTVSLQKELIAMGRDGGGRLISGGFSPLPYFDGHHMNGPYDGETSVLREACEMIEDEIKWMFAACPKSDDLT